MSEKVPSQYEARLALLQEFRKLLRLWDSGGLSDNGIADLRRDINRMIPPVREAIADAGADRVLTLRLPYSAGGGTVEVDPLRDPFTTYYRQSVIPNVIDMVDQSVGFYENLASDTGLVRMDRASGLDIEGAVERALRPSFRDTPPASEAQVQDALEVILQSIGVDYVREKEVASVGPKGFRPDFTVDSLQLAIEVKLATKTHDERSIQEELAADITAYRTKWRSLLAVIYDNGVISDPYQLRRDNMKHFGVTVIVVKH